MKINNKCGLRNDQLLVTESKTSDCKVKAKSLVFVYSTVSIVPVSTAL